MLIIDHLQKLGKICVTCQVNKSVDDANKDNLEGEQSLVNLLSSSSSTTTTTTKMCSVHDHLERVESLQEKVFIIFLLVLEHVVVVGVVVVVVHRAVGVDQEQGGGGGGGEGDGGRPG